MTSSEWIGLEIICYYCIYSTPRWVGSISPGGSVYEYPPQLYNILFSSASFVFTMWHYCAIVSVLAVWHLCILYHRLRIYRLTAEMAKLLCSSFKLPSPFNCFTQEDILFNCRRWKYLWPRSFSRQLWGKYCGILVQHGVMAWQTKEGLSFWIRIRSIHMVSCKLSIVHPKSLFAVVCSF